MTTFDTKPPAFAPRPRLPDWLRITLPTSDSYARTRSLLVELKLHTVCESAKCPNHWECWSKGTATFMIAGDHCTRACGFCAVTTARPLPLEDDEPARVAEAARRMNLKHVVITAVARDDLSDGGASHFARTIEKVRELCPGIVIEVLVPDFNGNEASIAAVLAAGPLIYNHNLETVRRLTPSVRHRATYDRSLSVLRKAKELQSGVQSPKSEVESPEAARGDQPSPGYGEAGARPTMRRSTAAPDEPGQADAAAQRPYRDSSRGRSPHRLAPGRSLARGRLEPRHLGSYGDQPGAHPDSESGQADLSALPGTERADARCYEEERVGGHRPPLQKSDERLFYTKSGLMLGLGETEEEVYQAMRDLRSAGCDILTLGQYLQPTLRHLPVVEFVRPGKFDEYKIAAQELGFIHVASGPMVRSSYHADEFKVS